MSLLSRRQLEIAAIVLAVAWGGLHWWADTTPLTEGKTDAPQFALSLLGNAVLNGIHSLEGRATDLQFVLRGSKRPNPDVVLAVVDEHSAQRCGLWPWSRSLVAEALLAMHRSAVAAVGMDIIFADEDKNNVANAYGDALKILDPLLAKSGSRTAATFADYRSELSRRALDSPDSRLAAALQEMPEVVQGVVAYPKKELLQFQSKLDEQENVLGSHVLRQLFGKAPGSYFNQKIERVPSWPNYSAQTSLPVLAQASKHVGHLNTVPDVDGTLRRVPVLTRLERPPGFLPALEVETAAVFLGSHLEPVYDPEIGRLEELRLPVAGRTALRIPLPSSEPYSPINYLGPPSVFKTVSLCDVAYGDFDADTFRGKAVLVGVTLVGNFDQRVTPFSGMQPGIYTRASFLSNILSQDFLVRPVALRGVELLFMLAGALFLSRAVREVRYWIKLVSTLVVAAVWLLAAQTLFGWGLKLAVVMPTTSIFVSSFGIIFLSYFSIDQEKVQLRSAFQYYLNESVLEQMLSDPTRLKLGGEKREMTVLFADIRGFTSLSELMSPEVLVRFINSYFTPMTQVVLEEGGTLDKYIGDALMAFWNAPIEQPDHALRACRTAIRFVEKLEILKKTTRNEHLREIDIGIGINSGPMVVGNMGSDIRFDYTVMGDSVNLAARLEGTNKEYGTRILISDATYQMVEESVVARQLGSVQVKGKKVPVQIYELLGLKT